MSKKRKFQDAFDQANDIDDNTPTKRRKISINIPESKIFKHQDDNNEYKSIYKTLRNANIIPIISQHIAEYSVGSVLECDNYQNCQNEVCITHNDKLIQPKDQNGYYYYDPSNANSSKNDEDELDDSDFDDFWKDDNESIQIFCAECCDKLEKCNVWDKHWRNTEFWFYCSRVFVVDGNIKKCECDQLIKSCRNHRGFCKDCNVEKCTNSFFKTRCHYHDQWPCSECNECVCNSKLFFCEQCDEKICDECVIEVCDCRDDKTHISCGISGIDDVIYCNFKDCRMPICLYCADDRNLKNCMECGEDVDFCDYCCLSVKSFQCPDCGALNKDDKANELEKEMKKQDNQS